MNLDKIRALYFSSSLMEKAKAFNEVVDWLIRNGSSDKIEAYNEGKAHAAEAVSRLYEFESALAALGYSKGPPG